MDTILIKILIPEGIEVKNSQLNDIISYVNSEAFHLEMFFRLRESYEKGSASVELIKGDQNNG